MDTTPPSPAPAIAPPRPGSFGPALAARLLNRRLRLLGSLDTVANVGCCLSAGCALNLANVIGSSFALGTTALLNGLVNGNADSKWLAGGYFAGLISAIGIMLGVRYGLLYIGRATFNSYYREASRWLFHTDMLTLFVDENQTAQIVELVTDTPGLRWMSPPRPRKLEELLEYAASYFGAYRKLFYGPGRLDAGSVFLGSFAWFLGQHQCLLLACCCTPLTLSVLGWPVWIFGGVSYLNRLAVEACCIDYLLGTPRDPAQASQPLPSTAPHEVGPPPA